MAHFPVTLLVAIVGINSTPVIDSILPQSAFVIGNQRGAGLHLTSLKVLYQRNQTQ
jgi:hypothetical protein